MKVNENAFPKKKEDRRNRNGQAVHVRVRCTIPAVHERRNDSRARAVQANGACALQRGQASPSPTQDRLGLKQNTIELPRRRKAMSSNQTSPIPAWHEAVLTIRNKAIRSRGKPVHVYLATACALPRALGAPPGWPPSFLPCSLLPSMSMHPSIVLLVPSPAILFHVHGWEGNPIQSNPVHRTEEIVLS